uniref:Uncharacterized protein n=1 Tax=Arundo donax TaxID=35708 RepID=A0A0A9ACC6_ARUDO
MAYYDLGRFAKLLPNVACIPCVFSGKNDN